MMSWHRKVILKSPDELETMRTAGRINAETLAAVHEKIQPGVSTAELNTVVSQATESCTAEILFRLIAVQSTMASLEIRHLLPGSEKSLQKLRNCLRSQSNHFMLAFQKW